MYEQWTVKSMKIQVKNISTKFIINTKTHSRPTLDKGLLFKMN